MLTVCPKPSAYTGNLVCRTDLFCQDLIIALNERLPFEKALAGRKVQRCEQDIEHDQYDLLRRDAAIFVSFRLRLPIVFIIVLNNDRLFILPLERTHRHTKSVHNDHNLIVPMLE